MEKQRVEDNGSLPKGDYGVVLLPKREGGGKEDDTEQRWMREGLSHYHVPVPENGRYVDSLLTGTPYRECTRFEYGGVILWNFWIEHPMIEEERAQRILSAP